jgi:hypothetical protein
MIIVVDVHDALMMMFDYDLMMIFAYELEMIIVYELMMIFDNDN